MLNSVWMLHYIASVLISFYITELAKAIRIYIVAKIIDLMRLVYCNSGPPPTKLTADGIDGPYCIKPTKVVHLSRVLAATLLQISYMKFPGVYCLLMALVFLF